MLTHTDKHAEAGARPRRLDTAIADAIAIGIAADLTAAGGLTAAARAIGRHEACRRCLVHNRACELEISGTELN